MIADVSIHIGVHEIRARSGKSGDCLQEPAPVGSAVDLEDRILKNAGLGGHPAQTDRLGAGRREHRTVPGGPDGLLNRSGSLDQNNFPLHARRLGLSAKLIPPRFGVEALDVEILHVVMQVGNAPRNAVVVSDDDSRSARQADAGHI